MAATFTDAPEVREIAEELIPLYHPGLHKFNVRIEFVFTDANPKSGGKTVLGQARKIGSLAAFLATMSEAAELAESTYEDDETDDLSSANAPFFCIVIPKKPWRDLSDAQKRALVDHELCHCGLEMSRSGELKYKLLSHDVEEFACIIDRHGLWKGDVRTFARSVRNAPQLSLWESEKEAQDAA